MSSNPNLTVSTDGNTINTRKLVYQMLHDTGFTGLFKLNVQSKSKGTGEHRGTVHLKRGHIGGIEIVSQFGDNDSCYMCSLIWENHDQKHLLLDLSSRLGQKKMFYGEGSTPPKVHHPDSPVSTTAKVATIAPTVESVLTPEEQFALTILRSLGETWFTFGNLRKSVFIPKGITDKMVAKNVLRYLISKQYLSKTGQKRGTRYLLTEAGKRARRGENTVVVSVKPTKVALPSEDKNLSSAQIHGLHMRSDEFAEAHVRVTDFNASIASATARKLAIESQLRGVVAELAALERDKGPYEVIMQDPDYRQDHQRYMALTKK
jgi:hypothetical protein